MRDIIEHTKQWIDEIIVGLNFCPFAKKEVVNDAIHYHVSNIGKRKTALKELIEQCELLVSNQGLETGIIIYADGFRNFDQYLTLVDDANEEIVACGFEGVFQLASFHPYYCFTGEDYDDPANYTNRSPYPMLHIIREESMERVLNVYKNPEAIPENNITLARSKGSNYFENVLSNILNKK